MDDKTEKRKSRALQRSLIAVLLIIFLVLLASYALRTSLYLKARLTPKLAELGLTVNGSFTFSDIHAIGLTGLILTDVTFTPAQEGTQPVHMDSVTVYPDMLGMFIGDLNASLVEIEHLEAALDFSSEDTPDIVWLKSLSGNLDQTTQNNIATNIAAPSQDHDIPALKCLNCNFELTADKSNKMVFQVEQQEAVIPAMDQIQLSGTPFRACRIHNEEETCFQLSLGTVQLGDSVRISRAELTKFEWNGISLNSLSLTSLEFGRNEQRNVLFVENGQVDLHLSEKSRFDAISGDYLFEFNQLELLHERVAGRYGLGIQLREPSGATAKLYGGYSESEKKVALTLDTSHFDIARFTQKADFTSKIRLDSFPITGDINIIIELDGQRAWLDLNAGIDGGSFYSPMLARDPIREFNARGTLKAFLDLENRLFELELSQAELGKIPVDIKLSRIQNEAGNFQFDASVHSKGDSSDFITSLPSGFAPAITGYELTGPYEFNIGVSYEENNIDNLILTTDFDLANVETRTFDPRSDFSILKKNAFQIRVNAASVPTLIGPKEPTWVSFYDLPRETAYTFVASEDGKFFTHPGFDVRAIRASLIADLKADKIVRGGSTISQQVVKNLFLNHDKTASRKFQEAFLTWQMEKSLTKLRIFELYLNLAHWAKDTYGIRAASAYYFQKPVNQLTLRESLFLASILPNPVIFGGQYIKGTLSSSRYNKMLNIGAALLSARRITKDQWDEAQALIKEGKISDRPKPAPIE